MSDISNKEETNILENKEYDLILKKYIEELNNFEKKGMKIAKDHLGSSFDLKKSSGFVKWNSELMKRNKQ